MIQNYDHIGFNESEIATHDIDFLISLHLLDQIKDILLPTINVITGLEDTIKMKGLIMKTLYPVIQSP